MTPANEPFDDWERGEEAAQSAFLRGALRVVLPALLIMAIGVGIHLATLIFGIFGVAYLPDAWIPAAVFYLCGIVAVETAIGTKVVLRKDDDSHRVLTNRMRWNRRIISRIATAPMTFLAFLAYRHGVGDLTAAIIFALLWITPVLLPLRTGGLDQRMRTLRAFLQGGEKNGPEA
jgi:hypothetical protein